MSQLLPFLPLIGGGHTRFQPIYVGDVAEAIVTVLENEKIGNKIYELGGGEIFTFEQLMNILLKEIKKNRFLLPIPFSFAKLMASILQVLPKPLITLDQIEMLKVDNVVTNQFATLSDINIKPTTIESILPNYIYRFRKGGEFA